MTDYCKHRGRYDLVKTRITNGTWQIRMRCNKCKDVFGTAISQDSVDMASLHEFEVKGLMGEPCARCGSPYAERHHYMPQSLARKAGVNPEEWATGYLCKECHEIWHSIVTPGLVPQKARRWEAPKPEKVTR